MIAYIFYGNKISIPKLILAEKYLRTFAQRMVKVNPKHLKDYA